MWTVAFHPDGKHLLGGTDNGISRWGLADGREVGRKMGMNMYAIAVSRDHRWIVCGTTKGASVWDGEMQKRVIGVGGGIGMCAVDVSPDSTKFATGATDKASNIWSITSGERLIGPLLHNNWVTGIRFSPTGEHIATACRANSICIFDSQTGGKLVVIDTVILPQRVGTPLAWSGDGQQIFAVSSDNKVRSFDTSTGFQLAESQILHDISEDVRSIALAGNGKFIATITPQSIWFLDTSALKQIAPVIKESEKIESIAISVDSGHLATGQHDGKIIIRDLSKHLPDSYGPFHVSSHNPSMLLPPSHQC